MAPQRAIFIVGTGRSGTHFTARTLNGFANSFDPMRGKENFPVLRQIAVAAITHRRFPTEAVQYYDELFAAAPRDSVVVDQHHPNLFFAAEIAARWSNTTFVYPSRPIEQVVASMMRHQGVLGWYDFARRRRNAVPFPNRFLGLDARRELTKLPLHLLCARRVIAHEAAWRDRERGDLACRRVDYTALVADQRGELERALGAELFASLGPAPSLETPRAESLTKFHDVLTDEQVEQISDEVSLRLPVGDGPAG